jgi:hypothetical protein
MVWSRGGLILGILWQRLMLLNSRRQAVAELLLQSSHSILNLNWTPLYHFCFGGCPNPAWRE